MNTYELDDLEQMLSETSPVVLRKLRPVASAGEVDPYAALGSYLEELGFKPPLDVEKRLAAMVFMGGESTSVHGTQVVVTASLLNAGRKIDDVVNLVLEATRAAAGDYGKRWNWSREEKAIRGMCDTWIKKHPGETQAKPAPRASASVTNLAQARDKKEQAEPKPKSQKVIDRENVHAVIGNAVLALLLKAGTPILTVGDQLWRYDNAECVWFEIDGKGRTFLGKMVETTVRSLGMTSNNKLIAESLGWLFRNPEISRDDIVWDDHGQIAVVGGLINIKTLAFTPASPAHHVTAHVTCDYDAKAECPVWLEMLQATFADKDDRDRADTIRMIQEVLGCALIEEKSKALSRALIFHGISNTGKTDLIKTISGLLTDRPIATPLGAVNGTHGLMEFLRKAPWVVHEAFNGQQWHFSDVVKSILSGDPVQINPKNGALITQRIRQAIFWGSNIAPQFREATRAIINRMIVISTTVEFDPKNPVGVAVAAKAAGYSEPSDLILATEKPGLLNWALIGLRRALDRGHFINTTEGEALLEDIRVNSNIVASFLEECVSFGPTYRIRVPDFCAAFSLHWEESKGPKAGPPGHIAVGRALLDTGDRCIGVDAKELRDTTHRFYGGMHLNKVGLAYWSSATTSDGFASRNRTVQTSNTADDVNRNIPLGWHHRPAVRRVMKADFSKHDAAEKARAESGAAGEAAGIAKDKAPKF